jgi:hypothetical protein
MTSEPAGESPSGANRLEEARRGGVEQNVIPRYDPIAPRMACERDVAEGLVSSLGRSWPRIFPGL